MDYQRRAQPLLVLWSVLGVAMSGFLSYRYYFTPGCHGGWLSCSVAGKTVLIAGIPPCLFGLIMFSSVLILVLVGWTRYHPGAFRRAIYYVSTVGTLFALGLSIYELFWLEAIKTGPTSCVYGFFLYLAIWLTVWRSQVAQPPMVNPTA